jgi:subtilisin
MENIQFLKPEDLKFDFVMSALSEVQDWGIFLSHIPEARQYTKGKGVKIAILDTGFTSHIDLNNNVKGRYSVVPGSPPDDKIFHSTHVAGIIAAEENNSGIIGVAPQADLYIIKVMSDSGTGGFQYIEDGLKLAISLGVDIINMSFGTSVTPPDSLHNLIIEAYNKGIILVAAAGNDSGAVNYPARWDEVIAVAAIDEQGNLASFSSRGDQIKLSAPGVNIYSTYGDNQYAVLNGTSQASPFIAGICALLLSWARESKEIEIKNSTDMLKILDDLCNDNGQITNINKELGYGVPNFANYKPWKQNNKVVVQSQSETQNNLNSTIITISPKNDMPLV